MIVNFSNVRFNSHTLSFKGKSTDSVPEQNSKTIMSDTPKVLTGLSAIGVVTIGVLALKNKGKSGKIIKDEVLSFVDFMRACKDYGYSNIKNITEDCIDENVIGSGAHSVVYKFAHPKMRNWAIKVDKPTFNDIPNEQLTKIVEVPDEFEGFNMGQEIAGIGSRIHILKRIHGVPHSVKDWSSHISQQNPMTAQEANSFLASIKKIVNFPQETFDDYAGKLKMLNEKGYKSDSFNPNNILVDYESKTLHIIDAYRYNPDVNMNSKYDLICPLVDYPNFTRYYSAMTNSQRAEYLNIVVSLSEKCSLASKKVGLSENEEKFTNMLTTVDERLNLNGFYSNAYKNMKSLLAESGLSLN